MTITGSGFAKCRKHFAKPLLYEVHEEERFAKPLPVVQNPEGILYNGEINVMDSLDAFRVMEDFADQVKDEMYRGVLLRILERHKPFRNFKDEVESGHEREAWFAFQEMRELEHIRKQLEMEMQRDDEDDD